MSPQASRFFAGAVICAALWAPAPAVAGEVLSVDGGRVTRIEDPFVPDGAGSDLGRPRVQPRPRPRSAPRAGAARAGTAAPRGKRKKKKGPTRGQKAVRRALSGAARARRISHPELNRYRRLYDRSRSTRKKLRGARGRELGGVIGTLEAIALRRQPCPRGYDRCFSSSGATSSTGPP